MHTEYLAQLHKKTHKNVFIPESVMHRLYQCSPTLLPMRCYSLYANE